LSLSHYSTNSIREATIENDLIRKWKQKWIFRGCQPQYWTARTNSGNWAGLIEKEEDGLL